MLFVNNFFHISTPEQRAKYLPRVLNGEWFAGMAMTEPDAGTDVLGMKTVAVPEGDYYILNGSKTYITNGHEGSVFLVYAKVRCERAEGRTSRKKTRVEEVEIARDEAFICERKWNSQVADKVSAFVVEKSFSGFSTGKPIPKCGNRGSTMTEIFLDGCRVPKENLLGEEGQGTAHMMRNLEIERLTLAAMSVGIAERCKLHFIH